MKRSERGARVHRLAVAVSRLVDRRPLRAGPRAAVFVHVPRTSGTSIIEDLGIERLNRPGDLTYFLDGRARHVTFDHIPPHALVEQRLVDPRYFERAYVHTLVRDPYTWAVSMHAILRMSGIVGDATDLVTWLRGVRRAHAAMRDAFPSPARLEEPEATWLTRGFRNSLDHEWLRRAWPQHVWLDGIRVDHVGRFEDRATYLRTVCAELGLAVPTVSHRRPAEGPGAGARYAAQPEAAELVRELYAEDFLRFGYDPHDVPMAGDVDPGTVRSGRGGTP